MSRMETMERKPPRPRRSFTPEFKAEVVALVHHGKSVGAVARELDLTETAVRAWVKQAELDAGTRSDGLTTAERSELASWAKNSEKPARNVTS
jgi:transposase